MCTLLILSDITPISTFTVQCMLYSNGLILRLKVALKSYKMLIINYISIKGLSVYFDKFFTVSKFAWLKVNRKLVTREEAKIEGLCNGKKFVLSMVIFTKIYSMQNLPSLKDTPLKLQIWGFNQICTVNFKNSWFKVIYWPCLSVIDTSYTNIEYSFWIVFRF